MKSKKHIINLALGISFATTLFVVGCSSSENAAVTKSGAELWGENCVRCHNAPSPTAFGDIQWEAIGQHMRIRAGLTAVQTDKVVEFLQMAN
ncbi:hypothetical protein MNBD_IGNAVI01-217 [hydrothermal vent metagenome]|uniref:Cytochrome c domain-containing protein n=1 Tax=hydrothermal vent metagenome TaxID=652676 RepID=A0A3B1DGN2_9ZZZZ